MSSHLPGNVNKCDVYFILTYYYLYTAQSAIVQICSEASEDRKLFYIVSYHSVDFNKATSSPELTDLAGFAYIKLKRRATLRFRCIATERKKATSKTRNQLRPTNSQTDLEVALC